MRPCSWSSASPSPTGPARARSETSSIWARSSPSSVSVGSIASSRGAAWRTACPCPAHLGGGVRSLGRYGHVLGHLRRGSSRSRASSSPSLVFAAMTGVHAAIGLGEGLITALVLSTVLRFRPELVDPERESSSSAGSLAVLGLVASSGLAFFLSPFACRWPDGLERVVERLGIEPARARLSMPTPLRDYAIPGLGGSTDLFDLRRGGPGNALDVRPVCAIGAWLAPRPARGEAAHGWAHPLRGHERRSPAPQLPGTSTRPFIAHRPRSSWARPWPSWPDWRWSLSTTPRPERSRRLVFVAGVSRLGRVSGVVVRRAAGRPSPSRSCSAWPSSPFPGRRVGGLRLRRVEEHRVRRGRPAPGPRREIEDVLGVLRKAGLRRSSSRRSRSSIVHLHVMVEESRRMQRARAARTWHARPLASWRAHASTIGLSFVRSVSRAERIFAAMLARGWS